MKLHGWIIYNGHLPGNKFLDFAEWLKNAATKKNIHTSIIKNNELLSVLGNGVLALLQQNRKSLPDFAIFTDKDIYLAQQLELLGIRVFNRTRTIAISDDKIATYQALAQKQLAIPKTIIAPKIFEHTNELDASFLQSVIDEFGFPMILKEAFGSFGEQVYLLHAEKDLRNKIKELPGKAFMFQEFIATSSGRDLRLHVVGNEVVAAMIRHATNDFRANVTAGGTMAAYQPDENEKMLAVRAAKAIGADFAGVDLLFGKDDQPIVCEVNSNAHIRNLYDCTSINVADFIIAYIIETLTAK